jgi:peptidoglycan biosynthesis protein MviN/MurJ (putative lipid II flippase)
VSAATEQSFAARSPGFIGGVYFAAQTADRLAGFGLLLVLAAVYGASGPADTYFLASIAPLAIGGVFGEPLARAFQTVLASQRSEEAGRSLASAGFGLTAVVVASLTAVYLAIALPLVSELRGGSLWTWVVLAVNGPALGLITYSSSVLVWLEDYVWSALRFPIVSVSMLALVGGVVAVTHSLLAVAAAVAFAYVLGTGLLYARIAQTLGVSWGLDFSRRGLAAAESMVRRRIRSPIVGGLLGGQVITLVERYLAAALPAGSVALLSYARGIAGAPSIVAQSLGAGRYPGVVRAQATDTVEAGMFVRQSFLRGLRATLLVAGAFAVFLALFSKDIVTALLQHGGFEAAAGHKAAHLLVLLALWTLSGSVAFFLTFVLYGIDFFAGILYFEGAVFVAYVILAPSLRGALGLDGLALALSLAHLAGVSIGLGVVVRRLGVSLLQLANHVVPAAWRVAVLALVSFAVRDGIGSGHAVLRLSTGVVVVGAATALFFATLDGTDSVRRRVAAARVRR